MRKTIAKILATTLGFAPLMVFAQSCPKWGPYLTAQFSDNTATADLLMDDVMIPANGNTQYTYTCAIQFGLGKSGGYCGLQNNNPTGEMVRPLNNIFSVWDYPNKIQIEAIYKDPQTFIGGFGNEGTGLHSHADFGWIPGSWYTQVVRRWYNGGDRTEVGYFIYDHRKKQWRHYVTFAVPEADAKLKPGISSFLENFADNTKHSRISYYKSYWMLTSDGNWEKPDTLMADAGEGYWNAEEYQKDGIKLTSCGPENIKRNKIKFPVTSSDRHPDNIESVHIYNLGAYYDKQKKQVYVNWSIDQANAPQLSYEVTLYDNRVGEGDPLAIAKGTDPDLRSVLLNVDRLSTEAKTYFVILKLKDIFNQKGEEKVFALHDMKP